MASLLLFLFLFLQSFVVFVRTETFFVKPGSGGETGDYEDNPRYKEGSDLNFKWTTDLKNVQLVLWQHYPREGNTYWTEVLIDDKSATNYTWTALFGSAFSTDGLDDGDDAVFFLALYDAKNKDAGSTDWDSTSHYFNVTRNEAAEKTQSASGSKPTNVRPQTADEGAIDGKTSSTSPSNEKSDSLSCGAVAGISVGATLGAVLVLGGMGFFLGKHLFGQRRGYEHPRGDEIKMEPAAPIQSQSYQPAVQHQPHSQPQAYHHGSPPVHEIP